MSESTDGATIITNAEVLQQGFVPNDSIHRNQEVNALSRTLEPITRGQPGGPALLTGPSGVGKTTFAQFAVDQLQRERPEVAAVHVNCWEAHTRFKTLFEILDELGRAADIHRHASAHDAVLDRLADGEGPIVVTLDEVDQLDDPGVAYDLYTMPHVSMLLITNDATELLQGVDERVRSRLQTAQQIHFDAYSTRQLIDILDARVEHGLADGALAESQLSWIAESAAGDARVGLSILRTAAQHAQYEGRGTVKRRNLEEAIPRGKEAVRSRTLNALRAEQRELFRLLQETGEISPGDLYEVFEEAIADPPTKRTMRSWLQKLAHYDLVEASGSGPTRTYEPTWDPSHITSP